MAIYVKPTGELAHLDDHLNRVKRLLHDIEALATGKYPAPGELADAPVLEDWRLAVHPVPCLVGTFFGHPKIQSGNLGRTSDLWIHAPSEGYARTLSRLYRLGPAAVSEELAQ